MGLCRASPGLNSMAPRAVGDHYLGYHESSSTSAKPSFKNTLIVQLPSRVLCNTSDPTFAAGAHYPRHRFSRLEETDPPVSTE